MLIKDVTVVFNSKKLYQPRIRFMKILTKVIGLSTVELFSQYKVSSPGEFISSELEEFSVKFTFSSQVNRFLKYKFSGRFTLELWLALSRKFLLLCIFAAQCFLFFLLFVYIKSKIFVAKKNCSFVVLNLESWMFVAV